MVLTTRTSVEVRKSDSYVMPYISAYNKSMIITVSVYAWLKEADLREYLKWRTNLLHELDYYFPVFV